MGGDPGRSGRAKLRFPSHSPWLPSHITPHLSPRQGWVIVCLGANCALGPITSHMGGLRPITRAGQGCIAVSSRAQNRIMGEVGKVGGHQMPLDGGEQTVPGSRVQLLVIFICPIFWIKLVTIKTHRFKGWIGSFNNALSFR